MHASALLARLISDPTTLVMAVYWLAASLTMIIAIALIIVGISEFRRTLTQTNAGPFRPGSAADAGLVSGPFRVSARDAFRASRS